MRNGFAVVDFETTGKYWNRDRIVEIGVILLTENFEVEDEFETLVNPERDMGPQEVHGVKAAWVYDAPKFADVGPELTRLLTGRAFVAHNANFDAHFAEREFQRLAPDFHLDWTAEEWLPNGVLCTKELSTIFFGQRAVNLAWLASQLGVVNEHAHAAIHDARTTAQVLARMAESPSVRREIERAVELRVPALKGAAVSFTTKVRPEGDSRSNSLYDQLQVLPVLSPAKGSDDYISHLIRSLQDQNLSIEEIRIAKELAQESGLTEADIQEAHERVISALASIFWSDGVLSEFEIAALRKYAEILGQDLPERILSGESVQAPRELPTYERLVLTGFDTSTKKMLTTRLEALGVEVLANFSKKADAVVARDPDTQSGKARAARQAGKPVFGEAFVAFLEERFRRDLDKHN